MNPVEASAVVPRLRFRQENEVKLSYSARITEVEWERHAEAVRYMHEQRKTRSEMLEALDKDYEFRPSMPQLNAHMKKRKLRVYGNGNDETVEVAQDEVSPAADVVAGADETSASTSLAATQNDCAFESRQMESLEPDLINCGAVPLDLPGDDEDGHPRFPEQLAPASVTIPADDVLDLSPLNLDSVTLEEVETSNNNTPLMLYMRSYRSRKHNIEEQGGFFSKSGSSRNILGPGAIRDKRNAIVQLDQCQSNRSNQYTAPGAASVCSFRSHPSDRSSLRAFRHFAAEVDRNKQLRRKDSQHSLRTPTLMSEDSWDFNLVTGMPSGYPPPSSIQQPKDTDWEAYRWNITDLYMNQNLSLSNTREYMRENYGFTASIYAYKSRISLWGVGNSRMRKDWMRFAVILRDRKAAGKTELTHIHVGNTRLAKEDYHKFLERYVESEAEFLKTARAFCDGIIENVGGSMSFTLVHPMAKI